MIWNRAPHRCDLYTIAVSTDAGGGVINTYTLAQSAVPCLINTASSATADMYSRQQITVSHTIGIKLSLITTTVTPGMKVVADGASYHVEGIRSGRAFMDIPAFCYLDVRQLL